MNNDIIFSCFAPIRVQSLAPFSAKQMSIRKHSSWFLQDITLYILKQTYEK